MISANTFPFYIYIIKEAKDSIILQIKINMKQGKGS